MRRMMKCAAMRAALIASLVCIASASAQEVVAPPAKAPALAVPTDPRAPMLGAAKQALASGDAVAALHHFGEALWFDPLDVDLLARIARESAIDADTRALYALRAWAAAADAKGAAKLPQELRTSLGPLAQAFDALVAARTAALAEIAATAKKCKGPNGTGGVGAPVVARWLRELGLELCREAPALAASAKGDLNDACAYRPDAHVATVNALTRLMRESLANTRIEPAVLAAKLLVGLAVQAGFKDLKGPKAPDMSKARADGNDGLAKARALIAKNVKPLTLDEMEQVFPDDRLAFTAEHATWANPGVAISSPKGLYRIETICGFDTLLGAVQTVELHHARLAKWYGQDPFVGRQGLVRIVPEASDLESEGEPFFWAGGFQSGDVTTVRFNAGTIEGLGRGLTHELTHRFDGAVYGGLPAWLAEGRAVFTGAAYFHSSSPAFADTVCSFGTIEEGMRKGYGDEEKLRKLVEGTIEDYRDNYTAGYALYIYLSTWEEPAGHKLFRPRFDEYLAAIAKGHADSLKLFTTKFCDGKDGRPKEFKEFAPRFAKFIESFYWQTWPNVDWVKERYRQDAPNDIGHAPDPDPLVFDAPTWRFSRSRAEPWFGQEQAAQAGELLMRFGQKADAAAAFVWAHEIDEFSTSRALLLADALDASNQPDVAWIARNLAADRTPQYASPAGRAPWLRSLTRLEKYLDLLAATSQQLAAADLQRAAAALLADRNRLARRLGVETIAPDSSGHAIDLVQAVPPFADVPHDAGRSGWVEDELTGYEDHRVKDLWYATGDGDLHVGRSKPRDQTGQLDRSAAQVDAFVRAKEWMPRAQYRVRGRIQFTTTYCTGAVILGYTRRDRNVRLGFGGGDFNYSIGVSDEAAKQDGVHVSLSGVRDAEGYGSIAPSVHVPFETPRDWFDFELLVDGALVVASIDGKLVASYMNPDSQPIEGFVGFASNAGAYRVEHPTIEALYRSDAAQVDDPRLSGLRLDQRGSTETELLLNRMTFGLTLHPTGTVVLWMPLPSEHEQYLAAGADSYPVGREVSLAVETMRTASDKQLAEGFDPPMILVLPRFWGEREKAKIAKELAKEPAVKCEIVLHDKLKKIARDGDSEEAKPQLMFVDSHGVLRFAETYTASGGILPDGLKTWLKLLQGRLPPGKTPAPGSKPGTAPGG